ncbi:hypothetical protein HPP92_000961 [Vanilla planifolia]|uniref:Uncharacterized protein n=1 Tax=Vanilla planifolia TaxID=51239 RepID=A0A835VHJ4_VANPL|nr:hypothetical protein HPP92_000961 [Vanilla planifolia]
MEASRPIQQCPLPVEGDSAGGGRKSRGKGGPDNGKFRYGEYASGLGKVGRGDTRAEEAGPSVARHLLHRRGSRPRIRPCGDRALRSPRSAQPPTIPAPNRRRASLHLRSPASPPSPCLLSVAPPLPRVLFYSLVLPDHVSTHRPCGGAQVRRFGCEVPSTAVFRGGGVAFRVDQLLAASLLQSAAAGEYGVSADAIDRRGVGLRRLLRCAFLLVERRGPLLLRSVRTRRSRINF